MESSFHANSRSAVSSIPISLGSASSVVTTTSVWPGSSIELFATMSSNRFETFWVSWNTESTSQVNPSGLGKTSVIRHDFSSRESMYCSIDRSLGCRGRSVLRSLRFTSIAISLIALDEIGEIMPLTYFQYYSVRYLIIVNSGSSLKCNVLPLSPTLYFRFAKCPYPCPCPPRRGDILNDTRGGCGPRGVSEDQLWRQYHISVSCTYRSEVRDFVRHSKTC